MSRFCGNFDEECVLCFSNIEELNFVIVTCNSGYSVSLFHCSQIK